MHLAVLDANSIATGDIVASTARVVKLGDCRWLYIAIQRAQTSALEASPLISLSMARSCWVIPPISVAPRLTP